MRFRAFRTGVIVAALGAVCGLSSPANAALVASDSFAYSAGAVAGNNGGGGFSAAYTGDGNITSPGLTYPNLLATGNKFTSASTNLGAFRDLASPINTNTGTIFVSFLASLPGTLPDYGGISFFSGGTEELFLGKPSNSNNYGFDVSGGVGSGKNGPAATSSAALLVYRLTFTATGETIDAYYNPTPGAALPATPGDTLVIPEGSFAATLTRIRLQSGTQPINFDEFRIGTTFADVTPVPEPASIGFLAVGGLALLARRRR